MPNTPDSDPPDRSDEEPPKEVVRRHFEAINTRDREAVEALHADDVMVHSAGRDVRGLDAVIRDWWSQLEAVPDLEDQIDILISEGHKVAVRYTTTGTHEGEFRGIEPTGVEVEVSSMAVCEVHDGRIVEWWNHPDRMGLFRQLGILESPLE